MSFGPWEGYIGNTIRVYLGTSYPTLAADAPLGGFNVGDVILNTAPATGIGPNFWQCTVAGSPGTWSPFPTASSVVTITGSGTVLTAANSTVIANTAGGVVSAALPSAVGLAGKEIKLIRNGASNATFTGSVDAGTTSVVLATNYAAVIIESDGTQWYSVGPKGTVTIT
jgi:hypothetical protein